MAGGPCRVGQHATSSRGILQAASPATGSYKMHQIEEQELIAHALETSPAAVPVEEPAAAASPTPVDG